MLYTVCVLHYSKFAIWQYEHGSQNIIVSDVIDQYHDDIIIIEGTTIKSHEYIVPKSKVDHYDGNDLYLNITRDDMILNFDFWDSVY